MAAFLNQFDNALVGRVLGPTQLGFYSIAGRLPYIFIISLAVSTGQVLFPAFATLDGEDMRRGFELSLRYTAVIALPLTAVLITLAAPMTLIVFGPRWGAAVAPTQVLCAWALMSPITQVCGQALKARGRATLLFALAIPQAVALVVGSLLLVHQGIVAVSWVQATIAIVAQCVTLQVTNRVIDFPLPRALGALGPPLVASLALAAVLYLISRVVSGAIPEVALGLVLGGGVYVGLLYRLMPDLVLGCETCCRPAGPTRPSHPDRRSPRPVLPRFPRRSPAKLTRPPPTSLERVPRTAREVARSARCRAARRAC